jgi:hypothetical protein
LSLNNQKKELSSYEREKAAVQQEQLKEIESQLDSLEKQYLQLQRTHDQIVAAIAALRVQIATTPISAPNLPATPAILNAEQVVANANLVQSSNASRALREAELQGYVLELNQNVQKQAAIMKNAEARITQRQLLLFQVHSESQRSQEFAHNLRRWERRLSISHKKVATKGDRSAVAVKTRISLLSTYESIQPQAELSQLAITLNVDP